MVGSNSRLRIIRKTIHRPVPLAEKRRRVEKATQVQREEFGRVEQAQKRHRTTVAQTCIKIVWCYFIQFRILNSYSRLES